MDRVPDKIQLLSFLRLSHDAVHRGKLRLGSMTPDGTLVYLEFDLSPTPSATWIEMLLAAAVDTVMEGRAKVKGAKLTVETTEEELEADVKRADGLLDTTNARYAARVAQAKSQVEQLRAQEVAALDPKQRMQARLRKLN